MAVRVFTDSDDVRWCVWATSPIKPECLGAEWRDGWLTFDCGASRRRLAPIPKNWEIAAADRLQLMCRAARSARTSDPSRDAARAIEDWAFETESESRTERHAARDV
jgi:hypothetical protein